MRNIINLGGRYCFLSIIPLSSNRELRNRLSGKEHRVSPLLAISINIRSIVIINTSRKIISIVLARPIIPCAIRSRRDDRRFLFSILLSFFSRGCTCAKEVRLLPELCRSLSFRHEINLSLVNRCESRHDRSLLVKHWTNFLARFR